MADRRGRICGDGLLRTALFRSKRRSRRIVFCDDAGSAARLYHALHFSLYVRGGPLPVRCEHRPDRSRFRRLGDTKSVQE
jgi:hypothetical protein